jgi:methyl-accepting chemotaxis protein
MMMLPQLNRERVIWWTFGIGLFIFLLTFVAMPAVNDALNSYNENVTRSVAYADSTQQYNKIFLSPFYRDTLPNNANTSFVVSVNPPDNIVAVISATITFSLQSSGQTINYTLWVNNQSCRNPSYYVSTTYAAAGQKQLMYDCSNIISKAGTYTVIIRPSGGISGATNAWLDLTYMNNPTGQVKYMGSTDYFSGEIATIFVQLQDAEGQSVNNASCIFNLYNTSNPLLSPIYSNQPMVFRGANGIYYYQFSTVGYPQGVYPTDAECTYVYDNFYYYTGVSQFPNLTLNAGTFQGGSPYDLNSGSDGLYYWASASGGLVNITYRFDNVSTNTTQITVIWLGESNNARTLTLYARNWSSGNNVVLGSVSLPGAAGASAPTGIDTLLTANIPEGNISQFLNSTGSVQIDAVMSGGAGQLFTNWVTLKTYKNLSYVTEVKGSSEVHLYPTNVNLNVTATVNVSDIVGSVWNYTNRTLTQNVTVDLAPVISRLDQMNGTINSILSLSQSINLTVAQTLALAQSMNLTTVQTLQLLQSMNLTQAQIQTIVGQINITVNDIKTIAGQTNLTVNQLYLLTQAVNLTASETLGIAIEMNLTTKQILYLAQQINATAFQNLAYLIDINNTVHEVNITTHDIRNIVTEVNLTVAQTLAFLQAFNLSTTGYLSEINITAHNNALSLQTILGLANQTNLTTQQILSLLQQMNTTFEIKLDNINNSANLLVNLSLEINATTHEVNVTIYQILNAVQGINFSQALAYLAEINATTHYNNLTIQQILLLADNINLTVAQTYGLLSYINVTFEQKLDVINGTVNEINMTTWNILNNLTVQNLSVDLTQVLAYLSEINGTTHLNNITINEVLGLAQSINLTEQQTYDLLSYMNVTFENKLDQINATVTDILYLSQAINLTTEQTLALANQLNFTTNQIWNLLLGMNNTLEQTFILSNTANVTTYQILQLSQDTNTTVYDILNNLAALNTTLYNLTVGNITVNANISSQTLSDISEKVWLQFLTLGTPPPMPSTSYYCSDNVTLVKDITFDVCSGAGCKQYTKLTNTFCEFGCDTKNNQCVPPPINRMGFIAVVIIGILGFIVILRRFA